MGEDLVTVVLDRASSDTSLTEKAKLLILAALEGDADLADALDTSRPTSAPAPADGPAGPPVRAFLSCVTVEGFRGIGPRASLPLTPGPGLVVVAGRNGSGKSSFAEALEVALTRGSYRWQHRKQAVWRESWRNLHQGDPASITVELAEESAGATTVGAQWAADAGLDEVQTWVQRRGAKREQGLDGLGWARDLELFRPFLSYDELGALFAEPSKLYTALASILGLERLEDAQGRLTEAQKTRCEGRRRGAGQATAQRAGSPGRRPSRRCACPDPQVQAGPGRCHCSGHGGNL
jgi:energy-coupling factor transporter ATP-binding protein EcfA2